MAEYQSRRAAWEKAAADILRQIDEIERPYREKGRAGAVAKFPDEIQAILSKPEQARIAAGAAAWGSGLSPGQPTSTTRCLRCSRGRSRPVGDELAQGAQAIRCQAAVRAGAGVDGDRRRAGVAADL